MSVLFSDEPDDVGHSDVQFIQTLKVSRPLAVFHVVVQQRECVMKVVHSASLPLR